MRFSGVGKARATPDIHVDLSLHVYITNLSTLHFLKIVKNSLEVLKVLKNSLEVLKVLKNSLEVLKVLQMELQENSSIDVFGSLSIKNPHPKCFEGC
nr:hypothetical protein [Tanacetum cinerariifolium]